MKAAILAAGEGVRLQPITATRPKHLIKVAGKPVLEHCLNALKRAGISEAVIVVHYMGDAIRQYFGDGKDFGLKIEYAEQQAVLGTGNAVSVVEPYVNDDFLLVNGDVLFAAEALKTVVDLHQSEKPATTMAVVPVEKPENYGIVELENGKHVKRIVEKPTREEAPTNLANAGIYVFSTEIFAKIKQTSATSRGEWEIPDALTLLINEKKPVLAVKIAGEDWIDIGRPWDLLEANRWALTRMKHKPFGFIEDGAHLVGPVTVAETARVRSGAYVEGPAFIDEEADIGPNCYIRPCTSIGRKVRVGNACEIKNSIIMDSTHIGHLSYVGDSIIGERGNLGAGTITANYRLDAGTIKMMVKDKHVDSGRKKLGAVLGDDVKTGINALLMPGVKVGNDSWIGPNLMVQRDLPPKSKLFLKQEVEKKN
jgi:UDP-N-acetylglucosamine diphosphorylase / glucose-1-phosphate thymidylyltransferase / UDP-N-acetylgalactosamine diphosphorylase / glucosamine-1-phosphate N-acetyltransferase / galactosamine-1-phosphate N-acetyltransferase